MQQSIQLPSYMWGMLSGLQLGHEADSSQETVHVVILPSSLLCVGCTVQPLNPNVCLARASGNPYGERIWFLQTRLVYGIPNGRWEALHPVLLTGLGPMLYSIPSKNPEPVEARYGAQRAESGGSVYMGPRVCPKSLRPGLFSPLKMISCEWFHVPFFLHPSLGLCSSALGCHPSSSMKVPLLELDKESK